MLPWDHLDIFAEKTFGESGFTCFEKFSFVGFGLKERRSPPKDGHYLQKKASGMSRPWGGFTVPVPTSSLTKIELTGKSLSESLTRFHF